MGRAYLTKARLKEIICDNKNLQAISSGLLMAVDGRDHLLDGHRHIDLLCEKIVREEDYQENIWVVFEIVPKRADGSHFGRLLSHMHALERDFSTLERERPGEFPVRNKVVGIIWAGEVPDDLRELVKRYSNCTPFIRLIEYRNVGDGQLEFENIIL